MADIAPGDLWRCCSADKFGVVVVGGQRTLFNGLECALLDVGRSSTAGLARNDGPLFLDTIWMHFGMGHLGGHVGLGIYGGITIQPLGLASLIRLLTQSTLSKPIPGLVVDYATIGFPRSLSDSAVPDHFLFFDGGPSFGPVTSII